MEKTLTYSYDKKRDALYVSVGPPREAISREIENDIFVHFAQDTHEILGFTIIDFEKKFTRAKKRGVPSLRIPLQATFRMARRSR